MRKVTLIILFLGLSKLALSQVLIGLIFGDKLNQGPIEFGLNATLNYSQISNIEDPKRNNRFSFGLYLDYKFSDRFKLGTGLYFKSSKGSAGLTPDELFWEIPSSIRQGNISRELNYFEIPAEVYFILNNRLSFGAGFYGAYLHGSQDIITEEINQGTNTFSRSLTNELTRWDGGVSAHIRWHFSGAPGVQISAGYQRGLVDIYRSESVTGYNDVVQLSFLFPIKMSIGQKEKSD